MSYVELAVNCHETIKSSFKKLARFEARATKSLGALTTALEETKANDESFERVKVKRDEASHDFKVFETQFEKCQNAFDDHCTEEDDDRIYELLVVAHEKMGEAYAKGISLYDAAKPVPLTEREVRLRKFQASRAEFLSKIQAKKEAQSAAKAQLDRTNLELEKIEDEFKKLELANSEVPLDTKPADQMKTDQVKTEALSAKPTETGKKDPGLFNYYSTPRWNLDSEVEEDFLLGDRVAERLQANRLQEALIQKAMLPPVTIETFDGDPLLYRSFKYNFENTVMKVT